MMQRIDKNHNSDRVSMEELETNSSQALEEAQRLGCDVSAIATYIQALKLQNETYWARAQYLEGYNETLFTKIVTLESK